MQNLSNELLVTKKKTDARLAEMQFESEEGRRKAASDEKERETVAAANIALEEALKTSILESANLTSEVDYLNNQLINKEEALLVIEKEASALQLSLDQMVADKEV